MYVIKAKLDLTVASSVEMKVPLEDFCLILIPQTLDNNILIKLIQAQFCLTTNIYHL